MIAKPGARGAVPQKPQPKPSPAQRVGNVTRQMAQRKPMTGAKPAAQPDPAPQAPTTPPWQQLRAAGIAGQGSAAANRAALAGLPQQGPPPTLQGPPMPMPRPGRPGMAQSGAAMGAQGLVDQMQRVGGGGQGMPPQMQRGGGIMPLGANLPPEVLQALQSGNFGGMPGQGFPGGPQAFQELPAHLQGFQGAPPQAQGMGGPGSDMGFQAGNGISHAGFWGGSSTPPQLQSGGGLQAPPMTRGRGGMQNAPGALDAYFAPQQVGRGFNY